MTAGLSIDPEQFLHEQLAQASPDLMHTGAQTSTLYGVDLNIEPKSPPRLAPAIPPTNSVPPWMLSTGASYVQKDRCSSPAAVSVAELF